jgi:DNA-binding GntR family transcriptional regulator
MPATFVKLNNRTLRARIAQEIRQAILDGRIRPGDRLLERSLSEQFGASLTSVREALIELESDGFVMKEPNSSTTVTQMSFKEVEDLLELRGVLEGMAAERAARSASEDQIASLEELFEQRLSAIRGGDIALFIRRDYAWHQMIWRACPNRAVEETLEKLVQKFFAFCTICLVSNEDYDAEQDAMAEFSILAAIKARDPEAARQAFLAVSRQWIQTARTIMFRQPGGAIDEMAVRPMQVNAQ